MGKTSFVVRKTWIPLFIGLTTEKAGELIQAIMYFQSGQDCPPEDPTIRAVYDAITSEMRKDNEKYEETCATKAEAGRLGGLAKAKRNKQNLANGSICQQKVAKCSKSKQNLPDTDNDCDSDTEKDIKDYCAEPQAAPVIDIPLNDGTDHHVTQQDVDEYQKLYPAVNVMQELRNMKGWCMDNPTRKKTKSGVRRFIGGWLAKEQNKGKNREPPDKNRFNRFPQQQYDFDNIKQRLVSNG